MLNLRPRKFLTLQAFAAAVRLPAGATLLRAVGIAAGLAAFLSIVTHRPLAGLAFIVLNRVMDGLAAARVSATGTSIRASYFWKAFDPVVRASLALAFALADPSRALAAAFLLTSFVAAVRPVPVSLDGDGQRRWPDAGWIEDTAIYAAFAFACIVPAWFSVIAYGVGMGCFVMAGLRMPSAIEPLK